MSGGQVHFQRIALIGIGLIGSSLAHVIRRDNLAGHIAVGDIDSGHCAKALELGIADSAGDDVAEAARDADLVIICSPIGTYASIAETIAPVLKPGAILSDVGSVKQAVLRDLSPHVPEGVHLIPAHPVAGTEHSGPESGFPELFDGRWCVLTPPDGADEAAVEKVAALWRSAGSMIEMMDPEHHDQVMAVTSHLPHLIAYTIVGTATDLEKSLRNEVVKFSASGFRDFTRIAASDPIMWRDVFLNNRDAVLEILQRFDEDLTAMQRAIRWGEADTLHELFSRTREIRRGVIDAKQA